MQTHIQDGNGFLCGTPRTPEAAAWQGHTNACPACARALAALRERVAELEAMVQRQGESPDATK